MNRQNNERAIGRRSEWKVLRGIGGVALMAAGVGVFTLGRLAGGEFLDRIISNSLVGLAVIGLPALVLIALGIQLAGWFRLEYPEPVDKIDAG